MFESLSFASLTNTVSKAANSLWDTTKNYLTIEPEPLWQKAMREPSYQAYLRFKSELERRHERALENIVSPYAVIASEQSTDLHREAIETLLQSNPEQALHYFYDDIINYLIDLSASTLASGIPDIQLFEQLLAFYEPYVPEDLYQTVLQQLQSIDKTNIQRSILTVTKKINQSFKLIQQDLNSEINEEKPLAQHQEPYHSINVKQLILMGAVGLLANRNSFGLGLATTALLAESVNAAYPTVANPIPTQYVNPGQTFSYDIDLNQVFNDADGDMMSFGGATTAGGSPLPSWMKAAPIKLWGKDYNNDIQDFTLVGGIAYVANGQYGLLILNVSDLTNRVFLASLAFLPNSGTGITGIAYGIAVQNQVAYVAQGTSGLQLIDVSNVNIPKLLGAYDLIGSGDSANDVVVQNNLAFVAYGTYGLQIVNVSNPNNPTLVGNYDTPGSSGAIDVAVQNGVAYVADDSSGLQIINVSNVTNPTLLGSYATLYYGYAVAVQNGIAYVVGGYSLQLINVSNASNPTLLGNYITPGYAYGVTVQNDVAYVAEYDLVLINVSNPRAPRLLGSYVTGAAVSVTVQNGVAYVAGGGGNLVFVNVSNASNPTRINCYDEYLSGDAHSVVVQNGAAYITINDVNVAMQIWNVSNPRCPRLLSNYKPFNAYGVAVKVQNGVAYLARAYSLDIVNVTDPTNPTRLGSAGIVTLNQYGRLDVKNGIAYMGEGVSGLQLFNVSNANSPTLLSIYDTPGNAFDVTVQNGVAYVADTNFGLQLINVSNPKAPVLLGNYNTPGNAYAVVVQNKVAYVADFTSLQIINVSNTSNPTFLGSINTGGFPGFAWGLTVQNGAAYVADAGPGLLIINVTNPSMPTLLGSYDTFGTAWDVTIQNEIAYVADGTAGLQIIDLSHARLFGVAPTNANGSYYFSVSATNANGEWISTNMELIVGTASPATSASSPVPTSSSATFTSGAPSATQASVSTQSVSPMTTPSVSDTGTSLLASDTGTASFGSTPSTSLSMPSSLPMTATMPQSSSPTATSPVPISTTPNPVPTTNTQPSSGAGDSPTANSASRLNGGVLSTALLLSTVGIGFLAKRREVEQPEEVPAQVVENTMRLCH